MTVPVREVATSGSKPILQKKKPKTFKPKKRLNKTRNTRSNENLKFDRRNRDERAKTN